MHFCPHLLYNTMLEYPINQCNLYMKGQKKIECYLEIILASQSSFLEERDREWEEQGRSELTRRRREWFPFVSDALALVWSMLIGVQDGQGSQTARRVEQSWEWCAREVERQWGAGEEGAWLCVAEKMGMRYISRSEGKGWICEMSVIRYTLPESSWGRLGDGCHATTHAVDIVHREAGLKLVSSKLKLI